MAGTRLGAAKAAATNKARYGENFYKKIGTLGGRNGHYGGFNIPEVASRAGRLGGKASRRGKRAA